VEGSEEGQVNLAVENWVDFILGGSVVGPIVAIIALLVFLKFAKWK
jgi:hypothetical protein